MNRKILSVLVLITIILSYTTPIVYAQEVDAATQNAARFGALTITPPLVAIVLAFITKNVVFSLFMGIFSGAYIISLADGNVITAFVGAFTKIIGYILSSLSDSWNAGIVLQCMTIGGLITLITRMGGARSSSRSTVQESYRPHQCPNYHMVFGSLCIL